MRTFLPVFFILLAPGIAIADVPSFDCAKATSKAEHLICGSSDLSSLDRTMGQVYHRAAAASTPTDRISLRSMQRGWLQSRELLCSGVYQLAAPAAERCLAVEYHRHIDTLTTYLSQHLATPNLVAQEAEASSSPDHPAAPADIVPPGDEPVDARATEREKVTALREQAKQIEAKPNLDANDVDNLRTIYNQLVQIPAAKGEELTNARYRMGLQQRIDQASEHLNKQRQAEQDETVRQRFLAQKQQRDATNLERERIDQEAENKRNAAVAQAQQLEEKERNQQTEVLLDKYGNLGPGRKFLGSTVHTPTGPFPVSVIKVFDCMNGKKAFQEDQGAWVLTDYHRTPGSDTTDKVSFVFEHEPDDMVMLTHIFANGDEVEPIRILATLATVVCK